MKFRKPQSWSTRSANAAQPHLRGSRLPQLLLATVVFLALAVSAAAQVRGEADLAIQGYYLGGSGVRLQDVTGSAFTFRSFFPQFGLLRGSFQGYSRAGGFQ